MKPCKALFAATAGITLALSGLASAQAAPQVTTFKIEIQGGGGCWKDQGSGNDYTVSACSTASNWHLVNGDGAYAELQDGTGWCATVSGSIIKAGNCIDGVNTQEWQYDPPPYYFFLNEYDAQQQNSATAAQGPGNPHPLLNSSNGTYGDTWMEV